MITRNQFIEFIKTAGMQKRALSSAKMWNAATKLLGKGYYLRSFKTMVGTKARVAARRDALNAALEKMPSPPVDVPSPYGYTVFDKPREAVRRLAIRYNHNYNSINHVIGRVRGLLPENTRVTPILNNPALNRVHKVYYDSAKNRLTNYRNKGKAQDIIQMANDVYF